MRGLALALLLPQTFVAPKSVDEMLAHYIAPDAPGCAVGVREQGKLTFSKGYGLASLEHRVPITPQTAFYAGSISKQFTAASVMHLVRQGKVSLDAPVRQYVPELPEFKEGNPTVRHLLHHVSGLRESYALLDLAGWRNGDDVSTEDDVMKLVRRMKALNFAPGSRYLYCNTGYILLARIVRNVSGQSLREFAAEHLFKPAGMTNSWFRDDHFEVVPRLAMGYVRDAKGRWRQAPAHVDTTGGGGLVTTIEDLANWKWPDDLTEPFRLTGGEQIAYRRGLVAGEFKGLATIGHGGALAGYRAHMLSFPSRQLAVIMLCNAVVPAEFLAKGIAPRFLWPDVIGGIEGEAIPLAKLPPFLGNKLADYAGLYYGEEVDAEFELRAKAGTLELRRPRNRTQVIEATGRDKFEIEGLGEIQFTRNSEGRVDRFVLLSPHTLNMEFVRRQR